jgi:hypothetical protein
LASATLMPLAEPLAGQGGADLIEVDDPALAPSPYSQRAGGQVEVGCLEPDQAGSGWGVGWPRVTYVDCDDVAVLHSRAILAGNPDAAAVQADPRSPREILDHPEVTRMLDLSQPAALLLVAVLHFIPDAEDPASLVAVLRDALARAAPWSSATAPPMISRSMSLERWRTTTRPLPRSGHADTRTSSGSSRAWT